jgi:hypothetical protein
MWERTLKSEGGRSARLHRLRLVAAMSTAALTAGLSIPVPALAIAPVNSVPMACPIISVADVAVLGSDTVVLGRRDGGPTSPGFDYLLCRITSTGSATWTRTIHEVMAPAPASVAVGATDIYVGWESMDASGWHHASVRRFGLDGVQHQSTVTASGEHDYFSDVAVAPDGRVYLTGSTEGWLGDGASSAANVPGAFVRSFESNLAVRWTRQFAGVVSTVDDPTPRWGAAFGAAIAADTTGIYVAGTVRGALSGGPAHRSGDDGFVRRYSATGFLIWTRQFNSIYPDGPSGPVDLPTFPRDIALSAAGVHVVGASAWLGNRDVDRRQDAFQRVYSRDGATIWTREIGGKNDDGALKVVPDAAGSVMFGFAPEGLAATPGLATMFLARFGPTGAVEGTLEYNPEAWWLEGAQITGDGKSIRIASLVTSAPSSQPNDTRTVPPVGTRLLKVDAVPPAVAGPVVHVAPKTTISSTSVSLDVVWTASDGASSIAASEVQISRDGGAYQALTVPSASSRSVRTTGTPGGTVRVRARALDAAGNLSPWVYGPVVRLLMVQETSTAILETASWSRVESFGALGGHVDRTANAGASARYSFTGRGIAWIGVAGPTRGKADIFIDGTFVVRIDTYSTIWSVRRVLFERAWSTSASHTIEIRNRGTAGHPRIDLDALVVVK